MLTMSREPQQLIEAIWTADDAVITLWYGKQVEVKSGDTVLYYQGATQMIFVDVVSEN